MEFMANTNADCCTPTGRYELCGCCAGVPYIQLTVVGGGTVQTAWLNTETGDTFTTKPVGFVTGTCSEAAASDVLKFSATAPTATVPFAAPKDGDTTIVTSNGSATGTITGYYRYEADTATWVKIPSTPLGGTEGQVLTSHADGTRTWETPAADIITTLTGTVTGHAIGTYTNEASAAVTLNETITKIDNAAFNATTGLLSFDYYDEAGVKTTAQTTIPVGDKYKSASATCNDIVSTGNLTFTVATGLAYTPLQNIIAYADDGHHMNGHVVSYDSATGVLVMNVDQKTGAGNYCSWTFNLDSIQPVTTVETVTTLTGTVAGHAIGTYTNEVAAVVTINETLTTLDSVTIVGTLLTIKYTGEDGTQITKTATIPAELPTGGTSGQVLTINPDGSYAWKTPTVTTVTNSVLVATGHAIDTLTINGVAQTINETVTTMTNVLTSGTKIGTYTNESGTAVDIYAPASTSAAWTTVTTNPTPTGNTGTLPRYTYNSATKDVYYVDATGVAKIVESGVPCGTVYFNSTDPATATIFDDVNPPVTNDPSLQNLECALYVGTDGGVWSSDGVSTYVTKTYNTPLSRRSVFTATAGQTVFTLPYMPISWGARAIITRNGVDISDAFSWVGAVATYVSAANGGKTIDAGDIIRIHYESY